ncbi:hypothetical protein [Acinetobacter gandensis]|uniref:hypothetical protein n=1 Tax=Acinetobacter gandensis TaxID=1443941 RepID=UPI003989F4A9
MECKNNYDEVVNPWLSIESKYPPKDGTLFVVWDEILQREIKPIHWCSKISDFASGETEWSGRFVFWRMNDGANHVAPHYYTN